MRLCLTAALLLLAGCGDDDTAPTDLGPPDMLTADLGPCGDCGDQVCEPASGMCVDCVTNAECDTAEASACGAGNECEACATSDDCTHAGLPPVCVAGVGCFECGDEDRQSADCGGETPVCDGTERSCRACEANDECDSGLCVDGACPAAADVVWVDKDDDACDEGGSGSSEVPFCELQTALDAGAAFVAVRDSSTPYNAIQRTGGGPVTVIATETGDSNASIAAEMSDQDAVRCLDGASLTLQRVRIEGRSGTDAGVQANDCTLTLTDVSVSGNGQSGVSATGGTVTLTDVSVSGNGGVGVNASAAADVTIRRSIVQENDGGGLELDGVRFDVRNTVVGGRGPEGNSETGVTIRNPMSGSAFVNNTITNNVTASGNAAGVDCNTPFALQNSLLWNNTGGAGDVRMCDTSSSAVDVDPSFDTDGYHLTAASTCCVDMADDGAAPDDDIDGDERPCGASADIGADELCP